MKDKSRKELHTNPGSKKYSLPARQVFKKNENCVMYLIGYEEYFLYKQRQQGEGNMKNLCLTIAFSSGLLLAAASESMALSPETEQLLELLQQKGVITRQDSDEFRKALEKGDTQENGEIKHHHSVQSLGERMEKIEKALDTVPGTGGRVHLSGLVEVELSAENTEDADGADETTSDITLAKAGLNLDADITDSIFGHVAFLYEDDDVTVDEAIIGVSGNEKFPFYFNAGKMYVPFGWYESHFISDPSTLTLGETNEGALVLGYANDMFDVSLGVFNGAVDEAGEDDTIDSFVASAAYTMPETGGFGLTAGISYTSNLAASDSLQEEIDTGEVEDLVGGFGAFVNISFQERFFLYAEYVSAVEDFNVGELAFDDTMALQPATWNFELAYALNPQIELAGRYGGSSEYGSVVPEDQFGVALLYSPFSNVSVVGEYLHSEFEDTSESDSGTVQFAIEF
jgi:hypothetical protein